VRRNRPTYLSIMPNAEAEAASRASFGVLRKYLDRLSIFLFMNLCIAYGLAIAYKSAAIDPHTLVIAAGLISSLMVTFFAFMTYHFAEERREAMARAVRAYRWHSIRALGAGA